MNKTVKILLTALILSFSLVFIVSAEEAVQTSAEATADENIQVADLGVSEPTVLPDSPFYFLKNLGRTIQDLVTIDPIKKAELKEKIANEKILETKKMIEKGASPEKIKRAVENYQQDIAKITAITQTIKEKAETSSSTAKFLDKYIQQQTLHQQILEKLETQVSSTTLAKIQEAREKHLENFAQVMTKLENKEKIQQRVEKNMEEIKGSDFKAIQNLEVLKRLEQKLPDQAKEAIQKVQENIMERLQERLSSSTPAQQEKLNNYIQNISKDKEKQLQIIQNIKNQIKTATTTPQSIQLKERLQQMENKLSPTTNVQPECKSLWWFDKTSTVCQQKKFCGAYMYLGLHTFATQEECQTALKKNMPATTTAQ
jgi:hypothetical protein